ncbi:hypothetical protein DUNSADRAFT_13033, partial [Dunaliella salina]
MQFVARAVAVRRFLCSFAEQLPAAKALYVAALSTSSALRFGRHIMQTRPFLESEDETRPRLGTWPQFEQ